MNFALYNPMAIGRVAVFLASAGLLPDCFRLTFAPLKSFYLFSTRYLNSLHNFAGLALCFQ
jgi:hypothetical protein